MSRFINPIPYYYFAAGGSLHFFEYDTDTYMVIYGDEEETTTIDNPVTLGDYGQVPNIFFSTAARVVLKKANGTQVFDVQPAALAGGASGQGVSGWVSNNTYGQLAIVYGSDANFYISLVNENVGNDPTDDTDDSAYWTRLNFFRFWNEQESFDANTLVIRNTKIYYSAINDNTGNDPALDTLGNWIDITDSSLSRYNNVASGLAATNVKTAIDELVTIINAITQPLVYKGVLDVSGGDGSLPVSPANGDLYIIGVGGTITVSTEGSAAVPTAVSVGEQIVWNDDDSRWDLIPFAQTASNIAYVNTTSGLSANNVQSAIDEVDARVDTNTVTIAGIQATLAGLGAGVTYKGVLDVSAGDSALPAAPSGGDLYAIAVGGTITVSVNGAAPALTAVTDGQQIVYNDNLIQWDLLTSVTSAGEISYSNVSSGLSAVNVQGAIDETVSKIIKPANQPASTSIARTGNITEVTRTGIASVVYTVDETGMAINDILRFRKPLQAGAMTVTTTTAQLMPDGVTTDTSSQFTDGTAGTLELVKTATNWQARVY